MWTSGMVKPGAVIRLGMPGSCFVCFGEFQAYFVPLMERRRAAPAEDLASAIANAEVDGKPINYFEAVSYYVIVAAAGHDTTSSSISGGLWALCENEDAFKTLKADASLIPRFVEEAIRWTTPVHHVMRTATARSRTARTAGRARRLVDVVLSFWQSRRGGFR